jgi:glycosyltransferase involved in cell wall biosynthesis
MVPKITVLMAVHNGGLFLQQAVESILRQSFHDFEFLIVDDASSDDSIMNLAVFQDERIRLLKNKKQLGLSRSLNIGLEAARGKYIARMDHDDASAPHRLKIQHDFMETHSTIDVLGSWAKTVGLRQEQTWRYPKKDEDIRSEFLFNSVLVHGSVMLRRATFDRYKLRYADKVARAQDYELWTRAADWVSFANIPRVLIRYRIHPHQVGRTQSVEQQVTADMVRGGEIRKLGLRPTAEELRLHNNAARWVFPKTRAGLQELEAWFLKLVTQNRVCRRYKTDPLKQSLENRWWAACRANIEYGVEALQIYQRSLLSTYIRRSVFEKAVFSGKALLREAGWRRE